MKKERLLLAQEVQEHEQRNDGKEYPGAGYSIHGNEDDNDDDDDNNNENTIKDDSDDGTEESALTALILFSKPTESKDNIDTDSSPEF